MLTSYLKYDKLFLSSTDSPDRRASFPHPGMDVGQLSDDQEDH